MTKPTNLTIDSETIAALDTIWKKELKPIGIRKSYSGTVRYVAKNYGVNDHLKNKIAQLMAETYLASDSKEELAAKFLERMERL